MSGFTPKRMGIVQADDKRKGRQFQAYLLGAVYADRTWDVGDAETKRPVWATFAASEAEMPAFEANLREGRPCAPATGAYGGSDGVRSRVEFVRSAEYAWSKQRTEEGVLLTAYLPSVFRHDPGFLDEESVRFVVLPSAEWTEAQRAALGEEEIHGALAHIDNVFSFGKDDAANGKDSTPAQRAAFRALVERMIPTAHLFVAALDKRVRLPVVPDLAFALQLFLTLHTALVGKFHGQPAAGSMLSTMIRNLNDVARRVGFEELGTEALGLAPGAWCAIGHKALAEILSAETKRYFEKRAKPRTARKTHRAA